jgi:hypothetical protein
MKVHNLLVTGSLTSGGENIGSISSSVATTNNTQDNRISSLEVTTGSLNTHTSSATIRLNSIETTTGSLNVFTSSTSPRLNSVESKTGSYATTGSNAFIGTQTITGSLFISSNLVVQGSSSLENITASAVNIGANIVNLNTANPAIRFAGLNIFDSGSIGGSGSFLYDAVQDEFIFIHRGDNDNITSSIVLMGPQTYNNVGNETYPTVNRLLKGTGNEHVGDSIVSEIGEGIGISGSLSVTGSMTASSSVGIGGASPTYRLTVYNASNGTTTAFGGTARGIRIDNDGTFSSGRSTIFGVDNSFYGSYQPMSIEASSLSLQAITGGNVGIGVTTPLSKFHVNTGTNQNFRVRPGTDVGATNGVAINSRSDDDGTLLQLTLRASDVIMLTSGNVGIGTATPVTFGARNLDVNAGAGASAYIVARANNNAGTIELAFDTDAGYLSTKSNHPLIIRTNDIERMRITSDGNVLVGSTNADVGGSVKGAIIRQNGSIVGATNISSPFHYQSPIAADRMNTQGDGLMYGMWRQGIFQAGIGATNGSAMTFFTGNNDSMTERMRITSGGSVGIGLTNPGAILDVSHTAGTSNIIRVSNGAGNYRWRVDQLFSMVMTNASNVDTFSVTTAGAGTFASNVTTSGNIELTSGANRNITLGSVTNYNYRLRTDGDDFVITEAGITDRLRYSYSNVRWTITGGLVISGSLSKGSGSFRINHPLPSKKDTHKLVHSFIEGPQADNIYRGKIVLVNGSATINLDSSARMTEGTFVLLNGNIQCFTSNESGWTSIRGNVEGNILTIESQDSECTDTISWLVIGERIDQHMIDTDWTDENGKVIVEPLITEV